MQNSPREIRKIDNSAITITWLDQSSTLLPARLLRTNCPCADCRERRGEASHATPITIKPKGLRVIQNSIEEELAIREIWGVGSYAIGIRWDDGHDTGIYTYDYLRELATRVTSN